MNPIRNLRQQFNIKNNIPNRLVELIESFTRQHISVVYF